MTNQFPEQIARDFIDKKLLECGWLIQDKNRINLSAKSGIVVRGYFTDSGPTDYVLFVDKKPVGIIEAKKADEGFHLTDVEDQSRRYAEGKLKYLDNEPLSFAYESTGEITRFTYYDDPKPRSREVFTFHKPETLLNWIKEEKTLRSRFYDIPELRNEGLRDCQIVAINKLGKSFKDNRPRALIQMATGSGKTYTAITSICRLLKFAKARRVLFLVDTRNLGEQAASVFTGELNEYIENVRKAHEQVIDHINPDKIVNVGWDKENQGKAETVIQDFKAWIESHKDEVTALQIFYDQPYRRRELTYKMIKDVYEIMKTEKPLLAPMNVWHAYQQSEQTNGSPRNELIALVSLIRKVTGIDTKLTAYDRTVDKNFQDWVFKKQAGTAPKFSEEQMQWLRMVKDYIANSFHIEKQLDKKGTGTTFRAISGETIRTTEIPIPPENKKHAIVSKIEELFSELDKGIESLRTAQQQLKTYQQSVLKWAFEGRLV